LSASKHPGAEGARKRTAWRWQLNHLLAAADRLLQPCELDDLDGSAWIARFGKFRPF
jgi:hypothetical protein